MLLKRGLKRHSALLRPPHGIWIRITICWTITQWRNCCNVLFEVGMRCNYSAGAIWTLRSEQYTWCRENLAYGKWTWDQHMGAFHFEDDKDYMWFRLRWSWNSFPTRSVIHALPVGGTIEATGIRFPHGVHKRLVRETGNTLTSVSFLNKRRTSLCFCWGGND